MNTFAKAARAAVFFAAIAPAAAGVRADVDLNGSWEFRFEEGKSLDEAARTDFLATDTMTVPGCYDTMPKWYLKRGTGLYRRTFTLESDVAAAWLTIDGMGLAGRFFLDGRELGTVALPYSRFHLPAGALSKGTHTLVAALDNRFDWRRLKLARAYYDFYLYGGFYHGVSLTFSRERLRVRTRDWRTGEVEVEVAGSESRPADFDAMLVFDGTNEVKAAFRNRRATVRTPLFRLWSPDAPNLHTVALDGTSARFGIRHIEARDRKIWLNGKPIYLKGANRHEAHPACGAATPETLMLQDIQNLKALGGNFFRGAHYPQAQRFLDLCDEYGVLVWEETLGWGNGPRYNNGGRAEFDDRKFLEDNLAQAELMVDASFNHPCVVIFAFMNEFASNTKKGRKIADAIIGKIKSFDSGRLVTFACNCNSDDISNANTDIISFNTYPGWIGSDPGGPANLKRLFASNIGEIVKSHRKRHPDKPIVVSETGTCGEYGRHDPAAAQWTEEFEAEYLTTATETIFPNREIAGFALWQFADCRSYHRAGSSVRVKPFAENLAGIYDGHRRAKTVVVEAVRKAFAGKEAGGGEAGKDGRR